MLEFSYIMDNIQQITKMRYQRVLDGLTENSLLKTLLAFFAWVFALLTDMFTTQPELIILLTIVIFLDWVTGNVRAKREGIPILSFGWRQSCVKVVEYAVVLFVLIGVGNTFSSIEGGGWGQGFFNFMENIEVFGFFFIIMTEIKSIIENLSGNTQTLEKLFDEIKKKLFSDNDIDI